MFQAGILKSGDPPKEDPEQSVLTLAERAGISGAERVLDAGSGICGPAIVIAQQYPEVVIDGVTVSERQTAIARRSAAAAGLSDRVRAHVADYQRLPFSNETFDRVLFFESTCYATDLDAAFGEAYRVLRPSGHIYVKDVFCVSGPLNDEQADQMRAFDELWGCWRSKTLDESAEAMSLAGFDVEFARTLTDVGISRFVGSHFDIDPVNGLTVSELGEAFMRPDNHPPLEFGEIKAVKPTGSAHATPALPPIARRGDFLDVANQGEAPSGASPHNPKSPSVQIRELYDPACMGTSRAREQDMCCGGEEACGCWGFQAVCLAASNEGQTDRRRVHMCRYVRCDLGL